MSIYAIAGQIGSGKSLFQLKLALELSNYKEKQLVCNFPLDRVAVKKYAIAKGYKHILKMLEFGGITEIHAPKKLQALLFPEAIVCLDEAGVLLNSRSWKDTPRELLADLCQSRKTGTDLIWAAQFAEQVDSQIRNLTQFWIEAAGLTYYHKPSRLPRLYWKRYYYMDAKMHNIWLGKNPSHLKTRLAFSYKYEGGLLTPSDRLLFDCFDTTTRLDVSTGGYSKIESFHNCQLSDRPAFYQGNAKTRAALLRASDSQFHGLLTHLIHV